MNVVKLIKDSLGKMTKSEYKVATYCLGNLNNFAFDTLDVVAAKIDTSTTSVIRFCRKLGFEGFKGFQEAVRSGFKYQPNLPDKFRRTVNIGSSDELLVRTVQQNIACIEQTFEELSHERINDAVSRISTAKRVFAFGMKESFALAHYAYTRLLTVRKNVCILNAGYNGEIETILSMNNQDVCLVFLFHRYTKQALQVLDMLKKQGVFVILVTSPPFDEVQDSASILIPCYVDSNGIKNSAIAPVCLADYLCNAVAVINGDEALDYMKQSEKLFEEFSVLKKPLRGSAL